VPRGELAHPLIERPAAYDHPQWVGSCDWGSCDHAGWGLRWSSNTQTYLTVCYGHANNRRGGWHDGRAEDCEEAADA